MGQGIFRGLLQAWMHWLIGTSGGRITNSGVKGVPERAGYVHTNPFSVRLKTMFSDARLLVTR